MSKKETLLPSLRQKIRKHTYIGEFRKWYSPFLTSKHSPKVTENDFLNHINNQSGRRSAAKSERDWYSPSTHLGLAPGAHRLSLPHFLKISKKCRFFYSKRAPSPAKTEVLHKKCVFFYSKKPPSLSKNRSFA